MSPKIELPKPTHEAACRALSTYLKEQFDVEVEGFDAVFLLDFILERIGPHIYNQALYDAQTHLAARMAALSDAVLELERSARSANRPASSKLSLGSRGNRLSSVP